MDAKNVARKKHKRKCCRVKLKQDVCDNLTKMLLVTDKIFLVFYLSLLVPALVCATIVSQDCVAITLICMYAVFSVRLISSNCIF